MNNKKDRVAALGWVLLAALLVVPACSRDKDPYRDWRAPQLLEEGERLLRAGDLDNADKVFRRGLRLAEKDGVRPEQTRVFLIRLLYIAATRENLPEALKLFERAGGGDPQAMDLPAASQIALLEQRAGKVDDARALAEKIAARLASRPPELEDKPLYLVDWIVVDRERTANVEINHAKEASDAFVAALTDFAETAIPGHRPIPTGLRRWITPYVDHLYDSDRSLVAQKVADIVERIDEVAGTDDDKRGCLPLDHTFPALGCLAEWPAK